MLRAVGTAAACSAALCLMGYFGPPGASAAFLLMPLPAFVLGYQGGVAAVACWALLTSAVLGLVFDARTAVFLLAFGGLPTMAAVSALLRHPRIEVAVGLATVLSVGALVAVLRASFGDLAAVSSAVETSWLKSFDDAIALYGQIGAPNDWLADLSAQREDLISGLLRIFPAVTVIAVSAVWFFNLRMSARWADWPQTRDLRRWKLPDELVWIFIASGFASLTPSEVVSTCASNAFLVMLACYFCQGLAIVSFHLQRLGTPLGLRIASYLLIALQYIVACVVLALGVFDLWGDFRRLHPADAPAGPDSD